MSSFHRTRLIPFLPVPVHFHPLPMWGCCYLWGPVVFRGRMFLSLSAMTSPISWFILLYVLSDCIPLPPFLLPFCDTLNAYPSHAGLLLPFRSRGVTWGCASQVFAGTSRIIGAIPSTTCIGRSLHMYVLFLYWLRYLGCLLHLLGN